jgi:DNA primase
MPAGACRRIYETCCRLSDSGTVPSFDRLMLAIDEPAIKSLLVELDEGAQAKRTRGGDPLALLNDLIRTFQQQEAQKQRPAQLVALRERRLDDSQETELLERILQQERNRHGISEPTDG